MDRCCSFLLVGDQPYARSMVESVKDVLGYRVVQMSDLKTPAVPGVDEVVRRPFNIELMLYRFSHLAAYRHDEMLILDTDVIAKRTLDDVWERSFEVALTRREGALAENGGADMADKMPFNTGVMFSRGRWFWGACQKWLERQSPNLHRWYGDQHAVAAVAARRIYSVLSLPCNEFNWSPNSREDTSDARLWHFKGAIRKKWIPSGSSLVSTSEKPPLTTFSANP